MKCYNVYLRCGKLKDKRSSESMCVFDELRYENDFFKDFYAANMIESIAGNVRKQFELLNYPMPIASILDRVRFKIIKENLPVDVSGIIGVSDSLKDIRGSKRIMLINEYENRGHQPLQWRLN